MLSLTVVVCSTKNGSRSYNFIIHKGICGGLAELLFICSTIAHLVFIYLSCNYTTKIWQNFLNQPDLLFFHIVYTLKPEIVTYSLSHIVLITNFWEFLQGYCRDKSETFTEL